MFNYALILGFLLAFLIHYLMRIFIFSPFRQEFTQKKLAELMQKNELGKEAIEVLFNSLHLDAIAHEKIKAVLNGIKKELSIPPVFFLPTLEEKIMQKGVAEFHKLSYELKNKAILETDSQDFYSNLINKWFLYLDRKRSYYLWGVTFLSFIVGASLALSAHGIQLLLKLN